MTIRIQILKVYLKKILNTLNTPSCEFAVDFHISILKFSRFQEY